jgi:TPR repeat protein
MDIGQPGPQNGPRNGSRGGNPRGATTDDYGRPSMDSQRPMPGNHHPRGASMDDFGRPSMDNQRPVPRGPPQGQPQVFPDQRRGPPGPAPGYGAPRQDGYTDRGYDDRGGRGPGPVSPLREDFAPPGRSMTMPNQPPIMGAGRPPPMPVDPMPNERPYNGPIGRAMPPRPSTATGMRQPPQRMYQNQAPVQPPPQQFPPDQYANGNGNLGPPQASHRPNESISDFYDAYYDPPESQQPRHVRSQSYGSEMPNFDLLAAKTAGQQRPSFDANLPPGGGPQGPPFDQQNSYPQQVQPDIRGRAQPQAAVFEMADGPVQGNYQQGYSQNDQYNDQQPGSQQGYGGYQEPLPQNQFPPRGTSSSQRLPGLPNGPKGGFVGLPAGPSPQNGGLPGPNSTPGLSPDALPAHPPPVRAGLVPNSVPNMAANKPPPVRNYNIAYSGASPGASAGALAALPPTAAKEEGPPPVTAEELERLRLTSKNNPTDYGTMFNLAQKLVEASEVLAPAIPDQKQRNKAREKYIMEAHKLLKKLVAANHAEAMFYFADCYGRGSLGLETDNKEAFTLYQSAAKAGHAAAAYRTAVCCELGNEEGGGTRKDPGKAIQWYKRAATLGDPPAMYKVGMILLKGLLGQPKNPREAVGWLKRAAERADAENPHALHELGLLYEQPQGPDGSIVRDEKYSFSLFSQAAELGYKFSQFRLGSAYEYGLFNCPIDPRQSIMWYSRAAVQEEHQSELALSGWYLTGSEGVLQQSDTEAYLWARKAAIAGNAKAEYAMGYFTEVGIGIPANLEDAKRWYWRAAGMSPIRRRKRKTNVTRSTKLPQGA